ncbi:MAG: HPP family protein [Sideroxydans sp.]|nr:HPP family protein [Sideroxydans sp.]
MNLATYFKSFVPHNTPIPFAEKLRSGLAGGIAIFALAWALHHLPQHEYPLLLLGSMAASAVLLFAVPHSPLAQPWNLVGGHFVSALTGWLCALYIGDPLLAAGIAVGTAIFLMYVLNCLHPPGAATALTLVLGATQFEKMGWHWVALIVFANAVISLLLAMLINSALPHRRYPLSPVAPAKPASAPIVVAETQDIAWALTQMDSALDINIDDLTQIYAMAQEHARSRMDAKLK